MEINTIITGLLIATTLVVATAGAYFYFRNKSLDDLRKDAYKLFLEIEHNPLYYKAGENKMVWVLQRIRNYLPSWAQKLITDELLEKTVRQWFVEIKDLLDDGKRNKSYAKEEQA